MKAILWDGHKQLSGELSLDDCGIRFELQDFKATDLSFSIPYSSMIKVCNYRLYDQSALGVEICSESGRRNVFVVENAKRLIDSIEKKKRDADEGIGVCNWIQKTNSNELSND